MGEYSSFTPTTLLRQASGDDQAAWTKLVMRYSRRVYEQAFRALRHHDDAEDVMQKVFAEAARHLLRQPRTVPNASFRGWLHCVTKRRIIDFQRARRRLTACAIGGTTNAEILKSLSAGDDAAPGGAVRRATAIEQAAIDAVRSRCRGTTWEVFQAVVSEGRDPGEVAAEFRITLNDVYLARSRVSRRLREELARMTKETRL